MAGSADGAANAGRQPGQSIRAVRVFVSSTFTDMQEERDELVKQVFPKLRELCDSRAVVWEEVDLRWGITDEQRDEGLVLPICLQEIRECRPYFIGMLGERYGWVPSEFDNELLDLEPWLAQYQGKSVTELEIIHGVLADPSMADHAFFYFRDPSYLPPGMVPGQADIERQKLFALKQQIRDSGVPVRENYANPRELGQLVLADLTRVVDSLFPAGSQPSLLERERGLHEAFAQSRARIYVQRPRLFSLLDQHVAGNGPPIAVLGEAGVGKSALLASWALRHLASEHDTSDVAADQIMLMHFVAASPTSADWAKMTQRIVAEVETHFGSSQLLAPTDPAGLRDRLKDALRIAATKGRSVVIIDGLDQLEDRDGAPDLAWLPLQLPSNIRLIVSTLPGRPQEEWVRRGWPAIQVTPLERGERATMIHEYLAQYAKQLPAELVNNVAAAPQTGNPLFLRLLLEELRLYGDHNTLRRRLDELLEAHDIPSLYRLILSRWEHDYQRDRPGLVAESMVLLWTARRGLSEAELRDLLGDDTGPLPHAVWSPLYLAAKQTLANHDGIIDFAHDHARRAVEKRYLTSQALRHAAHMHLAMYFLQTYNTGPSDGLGELLRAGRFNEAVRTLQRQRLLDELPWQVAQAGEWDELARLLGGDVLFSFAWLRDKFEVYRYWRDIEQHRPGAVFRTYADLIAVPERDWDMAWNVALLLKELGYKKQSSDIFGRLKTAPAEDSMSADARAGIQLNAAVAQFEADQGSDGLAGLETAIAEADYGGAERTLAAGLRNKAALLFKAEQHREALSLLEQAEAICRRLDDRDGIASCLTIRAPILDLLGEYNAAAAAFEQQQRIYRNSGDLDKLASALSNHANMLSRHGDSAAAEARLAEALAVVQRLDDDRRLARIYEVRARARLGRNWAGCISDLDECERLARETGERETEANALYLRGVAAVALGQWHAAESLATRAASIRRELNDEQGIARCSELARRAIEERVAEFRRTAPSGGS